MFIEYSTRRHKLNNGLKVFQYTNTKQIWYGKINSQLSKGENPPIFNLKSVLIEFTRPNVSKM